MAFRADRACRHQPAIIDPADARVLDAVALEAVLGGDSAVIVDGDNGEAVGTQFDRQEPGQRRQRHDFPVLTSDDELARIGGIRGVQGPGVQDIAAIVPADGMDVAIPDWMAQRLGNADHHK